MKKVVSLLLLFVLTVSMFVQTAKPAQADPQALPIPRSLFQHIHEQSFDDAGNNKTSAMNDGVGDDIALFLVGPDGKPRMMLCQTRDVADEVNSHWFHPAYGVGIPYIDSSGNDNFQFNGDPDWDLFFRKEQVGSIGGIPQSNPCQKESAENSPNQTPYYKDPTNEHGYPNNNAPSDAQPNNVFNKKWLGHYDAFYAGETYTIQAYGVQIDSQWNPFSSSSLFQETLTMAIASDGLSYTYSSNQAVTASGKTTSGDPQTYTYPVAPDNCTYLDSAYNTACPSKEIDPTSTKPSGLKSPYVFNIFATKTGGLSSLIAQVLNWLLQQLQKFVALMTALITNLITIPHAYFSADAAKSPILTAWTVARGFTDSIFVLILIVIAMANILRYDIERYDIRAALPRLVVSILLVNLSLLMIGLLVDLTNVATIAISNSFKTTSALASVTTASNAVIQGVDILIAVVLFILLVIVMLWLTLLLVFRVAAILALAALAPVAFMLYALPATAGLFQTWWKNMVRFLIIGPIIAFLLLMGSSVIKMVGSEKTSGNASLFSMFLAVAFVAIAGMVPVMVGGKVFAAFGNLTKRFGKRAGGLAARRAADTGAARGLATRLGTSRIPGLSSVGARLGAYSGAVAGEKAKKMVPLATMQSVAQKEAVLKNKRASAAQRFAAYQDLAQNELLTKESADDFYKGNTGAFTQQSLGLGLKAAKADPRIADTLQAEFQKRGMGLPPKLKDGSRSFASSMSAGDVAQTSIAALQGLDVNKKVIPGLRGSYSMSGGAFSGASQLHKEAIVGAINSAHYDGIASIIRAEKTKLMTQRGMNAAAATAQVAEDIRNSVGPFADTDFNGIRGFGNPSATGGIVDGI